MLKFTFKERILARLNLYPLPIYDAFAAPLVGHILAIALSLHIFEKLKVPQSIEKLAKAVNIDPKTAMLLLSSLSASGYVKTIGRKFTVSAAARKWLLERSDHYIGNFVRYVEVLYSHWLYLAKTLTAGEPPATYIESFGKKEWEIYVLGMMDLARVTFPHIARKMVLPEGAKNFLDLGGSHGFYSIKLCQRYPKLRATIVDFPEVLNITRKIIREQRGSHRISLKPGNVLEKSAFVESRFDAALASNLVHGLTADQNRLFLRNTSSSVRSGGYLYILDQFIDEKGSKLEQLIPLLVGINLMNEVGGSVYTPEQLREWCGEVGFGNMRVYRLRLPGVLLLRLQKI